MVLSDLHHGRGRGNHGSNLELFTFQRHCLFPTFFSLCSSLYALSIVLRLFSDLYGVLRIP